MKKYSKWIWAVVIVVVAGVAIYYGIFAYETYQCEKQSPAERNYQPCRPEPGMTYKPVIYLYPPSEQRVIVKLAPKGELTVSNPKYDDHIGGWSVTANPNGTLVQPETGETFTSLFWEAKQNLRIPDGQGFVVSGKETGDFLNQTLDILGLNNREKSEFISFWLPFMEKNNYNQIYFIIDNDYSQQVAEISVEPKPDTMRRIMMVYKPLKKYVPTEKQILPTFERSGFAVVEWGGSQEKNE